MNNIDKFKLTQLFERYGYESLRAAMALNESFTNNILRMLFMVNKNEHTGLDGKKVAPLSPVGAAFALSFPILWDKIPEKNIEVLLDNKFKENVPNSDRLDDNTYDHKSSNYPETAPLFNKWKRYKTSSYVNSGHEEEVLTAKFNQAKNFLTHLTDKLKPFLDKISVEAKYDQRLESKVDEFREALKILEKAKKTFENAVNRRDNWIDDSFIVTIEELESLKELIGRSLPSFVISAAESAIDVLNNNVIQITDDEGKVKSVRRYGTEERIRVKDDFLDSFETIDDMKYVKVFDVLSVMADKEMVTEDDIKDILENYGSKYLKNRDDVKRFLGKFGHTVFAKDKRTVDYYSLTKDERAKFTKMVEEKLEPMYKEIREIYKTKKAEIKESGSSDAATLLKELYMRGTAYGDHGKGELRHSIYDKILMGYNMEGSKSGYSYKESTKDDFKLALLTDSEFRILYVVSIIRFKNKHGFEYAPYKLYGWEEGMTPSVMGEAFLKRPLTRGSRTMSLPNKNIDFSYAYIDPDTIDKDDRIRAAIVINGDCEKKAELDDEAKFNKELLKRFKEESLGNINADENLESQNIDGVVSLLKKYHIPYKNNPDGTVKILVEDYDSEDYENLATKIFPQLGYLGFDEKKFKEMMGDLKACTEDIDMFDTFYTKKSTFSSYYDKLTKGKKFRGADGKKITNKYIEHLDINHENDSVASRLEFDKERLNIFNGILDRKNEIEEEINDYLIARDSIVRIYVKASEAETRTLGDDVRTRQALATARGNRYLTPDEEREAEAKATNGLTQQDIADANAASRDLKIQLNGIDRIAESVKTLSVDLRGWTDIYKKVNETIGLPFATFDKMKEAFLKVLTDAKIAMKKSDNPIEIYNTCADLYDEYFNMISALGGVYIDEDDKEAAYKEIANTINAYDDVFENEYLYDKLSKLGVNISASWE